MSQENTNDFDEAFYKSVNDELVNDILPYWEKNARDMRPDFEGFYASISSAGIVDSSLPRSIVMTSRFLWTYSAAARYFKNADYLNMADFAYRTIVSKFWDNQNG